ncbi:uncharacterized protein LOC134776396 isoform X1 [Penaeus indicus]|uniref:uncharacterized protein LOC134776396 isoform X1 n=1 Tax=Penaeus indicus TaxID=29960 RepID=UPI00300CD519
MKAVCIVALFAALCVAPFRAERPPAGMLRPLPRPGHEGVRTLPALLPDDLRQTRPARPDVPPFQRPQIQPRHPSFIKQTKPLPRPVGVETLPAELPEDFRQTRPFARPAGVNTLPADLPEDLQGSRKQTRPFVRPDVPSFQRPQIQPRHPSFLMQTKPLPRPVGVETLPAELPEDLKQTRPFARPAGVNTLPADLPEDLRGSRKQMRPFDRPDVPSFQRPQIQPQHPSFTKQTKPLPRPVELPGDLKQTRPFARPPVPSLQRPNPWSLHVPQGEAEICQSCERLPFVRRGACCKRWNLCC